ncbi:MAG: chemotaxis response regulator protein-glutamate methylesterase [Candidatus Schekmanbacteria bacterium]|nr:chemotaxis response regulator protein-glutamate methylesterase [Candidatus Schekmanbacteria bacterium]
MIRVLITEDSSFMRNSLRRMLETGTACTVCGMARTGAEAVALVASLAPDVVTLDVEMPGMDGVEALRRIMAARPTPVVMVSAFTAAGAELTLRCLELGAVDFVQKPSGAVSLDMARVQEELVRKVVAAARARPRVLRDGPAQRAGDRVRLPDGLRPDAGGLAAFPVVGIGASTGGPGTLQRLLPCLPSELPAAVLVVQHMPAAFVPAFVRRLSECCALPVRLAEDRTPLAPGCILVAPGDAHLLVSSTRRLLLDDGPPVNGFRPSIDVTFKSLAQHVRERAVGTVLTGMAGDGADGVRAIKAAGGATLAQDEDSCVVFGMPGAAIATGCVERVAAAGAIPTEIVRMVLAAARRVEC